MKPIEFIYGVVNAFKHTVVWVSYILFVLACTAIALLISIIK